MSKAYDTLSKYYDYLQKDIDYNNWINMVKIHDKNSKILEIGCGTGTLAKKLSDLGYKIDAFDISAPMIKKAKLKSKEANFFVDDILCFDLDKKYDLIICFMDTVNYLIDTKSIEKAFLNVYNHLLDNGVFLFDVHKVENIDTFHGYLENGFIKNDEYRWVSLLKDPINNIVSHDFTFITKGKKIHENHVQKIMDVLYYKLILEKHFKRVSYKSDDYRIYFECVKEKDA